MSEVSDSSSMLPGTSEPSSNAICASEVGNKIEGDESVRQSGTKNKTATVKIEKDCWFYLHGRCRYGRNCKYRHPRVTRTPQYRSYNPEYYRGNQMNSYPSHSRGFNHRSNWFDGYNNVRGPSKDEASPDVMKSVPGKSGNGFENNYPKPRRCRVFTNSNRYAQYSDAGKPAESSQTTERKVFHSEKFSRTVMNTRQPIILSRVNKEDLSRLRVTEVSQFKKRYPDLQLEHCEEEDIFEFLFSSSDPDWAFDLKSVILQVSLPHNYPKEACKVKVIEDEMMPTMLLKFLNDQIANWLINRHKTFLAAGEAELVLRPFFRWLDRNLEQLFIEGLRKVKLDVEAKKAGIEFVPFESLPGSALTSATNTDPNADEQKENIAYQNQAENCEQGNGEIAQGDSGACDNADKINDKLVPSGSQATSKKGTEIKLLNFELKDGAASLQCQKLTVTVRCTRCKAYNEMIGLSKQKHHSFTCPKCHQQQTADFQPVLLHAFSNILGYLHLVGCQAVDLPLAQCSFLIDCFNCNRQNSTDGIHYGQNHSTWCLFCNQKMCVSAHSAKFNLLQPAERRITKINDGWKKAKEPVIEVGKPLPNNGTCQHYRKSYRWLRFPCCGKAYACDLCHDENETDHEMKYASRMICGLCGKEQPYTKGQPCVHCCSTLTKKSGTHWEGGKGCRDKIRMSREDKQKYSGVNKTVSRKAVGVQPRKVRN